MRAIFIEEALKAVQREIEKPVPDGQQVIIEVEYVGICGSDISAWKRGLKSEARGHEFMGRVVDPGASGLKAGDRVTAMEISPCCTCEACKNDRANLCPQTLVHAVGLSDVNGAMADYVAVRPDMVRKIPDSISDVQGAVIEPAAVALHGCRQGNVGPGKKVLILGTGAIGLLAAACSKTLGASYVAMTEVNEQRIDFARQTGFADAVFQAKDTEHEEKMREACGGYFDAILDCTGVPFTMESGLRLLKSGGNIVIIGNYGDLCFPKVRIMLTEWNMTGSYFFKISDFDDVIRFMEEGKLDVESIVTKIADFSEAVSCFEELGGGETENIKILLRVKSQ